MDGERISVIWKLAARALPVLLFCALTAAEGAAAERWTPGFLSLSAAAPESGRRLDIAVWYPAPATRRGAGTLHIDGWTFAGRRNLRPGEGPFPLLIISHDSAGSRLSNHDLAAFLAERGFVAAVPTCPRDNARSMSRVFLPEQVTARPEYIRLTLEAVRASTHFPEGCIDARRTGVIGVGAGATAPLLLAGAIPNGARIAEYCENAAEDDPYCTKWAQERLLGMRAVFNGNFPPQTDGRVGAIALLAPGYGMLFPPESLAKVSVPVFIASGNRDRIAPPALHAEFIRAGLSGRPETLALEADHQAFSAPCPEEERRELPALCTNLTPDEHRDMRRLLFNRLADFFHTTLGADAP